MAIEYTPQDSSPPVTAIDYEPQNTSGLVSDPAEGGSFSASNDAELAGAQSFAAKAKEAQNAAEQAESNAEQSATNAAASASAAQNLEITSASFNTADGTLTLTKANSNTITADFDGRYAELTGATFTGNVILPDDVELKFGDSDLRIYHSSSTNGSIIREQGTGSLLIQGENLSLTDLSTQHYLQGVAGGETSLFYNGDQKLATNTDGVEVTGNVEATEFIGDLRGAVVFKAQAGEALTKGDVVYISGISGNTTVVSKADADDSTKMQGFGLAATDANNNANLEVYTFGTLHGLNTSAYALGAELYVSTTAGQLTDTPPTGESSALQKIAKVTRVHATSGSVKIMGAGRTNATPNLNDGNIFIGDSNNVATTASFTTEVANATTGKADTTGDTFTGDVLFNDGVKAKFGTDSDLLIYHNNGEPSVIEDAGELGLVLKTNGNVFAVASDTNENMITATPDGGVSLYYDNDLRLVTASTIVSVSNDINFSVNSDTLFVDSNNNRVGINDSSPSEALDVVGNIAVSGTVDGVDIATLNSNAIVDGDFTSNGFMKRTGSGTYTVDTNTYLTSFDITTQTDPKYLRSDADDTTTGTITADGGFSTSTGHFATTTGNITSSYGSISVGGLVSAPNVDIHTSGTVTTNIATGNHDNTVSTKTVNIGTGFAGFFGGMTTVNIGTQSTTNQNTVNIGSGALVTSPDTINLKGNVTIDGTLNGLAIPYNRVRYEKLRYNNASVTLTPSYLNISQTPEIYSPSTPVKCSRYIDFQTEIEWRYISSTNNDLRFKLEVTVPTSSATVTTLGTATAGVFSGYATSGFEGWFYVSGDFTHHLTAFGRMNKTGTSGVTEVPARAWQYDAVNNRTYILTDSNPGYSVSTGDTMYWHPYAWENAGTTLFVEDTLSERYVGSGSRQNITLRFKTAYDDSQLKYKAYLKELTTSDSAIVRGGEATLTDVGDV